MKTRPNYPHNMIAHNPRYKLKASYINMDPHKRIIDDILINFENIYFKIIVLTCLEI
jgi:hypothetical protein